MKPTTSTPSAELTDKERNDRSLPYRRGLTYLPAPRRCGNGHRCYLWPCVSCSSEARKLITRLSA